MTNRARFRAVPVIPMLVGLTALGLFAEGYGPSRWSACSPAEWHSARA